MNFIEMCLLIIKPEEGFRVKPYYCTEGYPTIGYGRVIGAKGSELPDISTNEDEEMSWLLSELQNIIALVSNKHALVWHRCNDARKSILVSMCYQLGLAGMSNFKMMLASICEEDFDSAAFHMLDSKWARQTPNRAERHAEQMQTGVLLDYYGA